MANFGASSEPRNHVVLIPMSKRRNSKHSIHVAVIWLELLSREVKDSRWVIDLKIFINATS